jgi:hypothetical protein
VEWLRSGRLGHALSFFRSGIGGRSGWLLCEGANRRHCQRDDTNSSGSVFMILILYVALFDQYV